MARNRVKNLARGVLLFVVTVSSLLQGWPFYIQRIQAAPPSFVACGAYQSPKNSNAITLDLPIGIQNNDILLLFLETANEAITIANANGGTWTEVTDSPQGTGTAGGTSATSLTVFWSRYNGTQGAPTTDDSGDHQNGVICAWRNVITTGNPWDVTSGGVEATSDTSWSITGDTTTVDNTTVVVAGARMDDSAAAHFSNWTNASLDNFVEIADDGQTGGNGGGIGVATGEKSSAGSYNATTVTNGTATVKGFMTIALKPLPTLTTLATGSDPSDSTVAPGSSGNYIDQFTLVSNIGTDSVTALTVTTANTSAVSSVEIWNDAMSTQYFSTVSSPSGNAWNFSGGTAISVSTSIVSFRVVFTATSQASLSAGSYGVTAYVSAFTSTNSQAGSDTGATITIDNSAPSAATATGGIAAFEKITLSWTTSASSDFSRSVVLRWAASTPGSEVPAEGTDYSAGNTITTATVACVRTADAASASVTDAVDGSGGGGGCATTALTTGQDYSYKIFQKDSYGNYDSGTTFTGSPFTPIPAGSLSVDIVDAGGSSVASPSMAMNDGTLAFVYQTSSGTFGVAGQKIRVTNTTATETWTLSIGATAGTTAVWDSAGTDYDFNDPTASADDGGDADSVGGRMTIDPSVSTITPEGGCSSTGLTKGSSTGFSEGVTDSITLVTAGATAETSCYWDITGISISQTVPAEQPAASDYNINMTVSVVAS